MRSSRRKAGGPHGLPALFVPALLAAALAAACSRDSGGPGAGGNPGASLWETPPLPAPVTMTVDGEEVPGEVVRSYLLPRWTRLTLSSDPKAPREELEHRFFADPEDLFGDLVRGVLLGQEARRRFGDPDPAEVEAFRAAMEEQTGEIYVALERRLGREGVLEHAERELLERKLFEQFAAEAPPVTDDEVYRKYEELMKAAGDDDSLRRAGITYESMAPKIRARLTQDAGIAEQEAWIDRRLADGIPVEVRLPDGRVVRWRTVAPDRTTDDSSG